jgi:hypothetical protein
MLEVSGAHTHKYRELVEKLGVTCLVLTDLHSVNKEGGSCYPQKKLGQKTNNDTLRLWHPCKESLDALVGLDNKDHTTSEGGAQIYIAFQKPTLIADDSILSRTFEDALILANFENEYFMKYPKLKDAKEDHESDSKSLAESLYKYVQGLKKGDFAFDCLLHLSGDEENSFNPPEYMSNGLKWLDIQLKPES